MDLLSFHWIDISAIVLTVFSILFGFFRGFTRELLAVIAWVAATVVTDMTFNWTFATVEANISGNVILIAGVASVGMFILLLIIFILLGGPLWRSVRRSSFWLVDSVLGLFLGLVRGLLVLCILAVALSYLTTNSDRSGWAGSSRFLTYADDGARGLLSFVKALPYERVQKDWFQSMMNDIEKQMGPRLIPSALESRAEEFRAEEFQAGEFQAATIQEASGLQETGRKAVRFKT